MEITAKRLQFSSFTLDLDRLCLLGQSGRAALRPKSFDVLRYLVAHPRRVISKDELIKAVWPNVIVTDESLTRCVSDVRHALGDASQQIIKTVPKRGYLLDLEVSILDTVTGLEPEAIKAGTPDDFFFPTEGPIVEVFPFAAISGGSQHANCINGIAPLAARAQQPNRMRRIGVFTPYPADEPEGHARLTAFAQALQQSGWAVGQNVQINYRWGDGKPATMRKYAAELIALAPDVVLASSSAALAPLLDATRTVPIVFAGVGDPVGAGYVESLARPGGNATGFLVYEYGIAAKWLALLKEVAPRVTRVAVFRDSSIAAGPGLFGAIQAVAPSFGVELSAVGVRDAGEIERTVAAFAQASGGGLIVPGRASIHRGVIIALAAKHRLPAVYTSRYLAAAGGLISYGPDLLDQHRRAVGYVDRILRGEKPADLPVQAPPKYELVINLKTAKALGLKIPEAFLLRADEVIE